MYISSDKINLVIGLAGIRQKCHGQNAGRRKWLVQGGSSGCITPYLYSIEAKESYTNCSFFLSDSNTNNALRPSWAVDYTSWKSTWGGLTQAVKVTEG